MTKQQKTGVWILLGCVIFAFFRWIFGVAVPEIALEFSLGTTFILISGLMVGRALTVMAIRSNALTDWPRTITVLILFIVAGFVAIAFLLNAMIQETTLFRFAITILLLFLVNAAIGAIIKVIRHRYQTKIESAHAAMAQSKSELQLLQAQLSPHFLFNTLNNLYGLSLTDPTRVPALLLKLSELLRYSVYDVKDMFVPLQYEVDYIRNYIEFEKLRLGERLKLSLQLDPVSEGDCKIPPLMLIVFVENAFKHSRKTGEELIYIDVGLRKKENSIVFSIVNSCAPKPDSGQDREKHSGFGLESVRKRLDLLYPARHTLKIEKTETRYVVQLELKCQ